MRIRIQRRILLIGLVLVSWGTLSGCRGGHTNSVASQPSLVAQQLQEIDSNDHMPPQAKAAARAAILQNQNIDRRPRH